jgi:hypothetical protein
MQKAFIMMQIGLFYEVSILNFTLKQLSDLLTYIDGAYAPNTLGAYKADMLEFIAYCDKTGECELPAEP